MELDMKEIENFETGLEPAKIIGISFGEDRKIRSYIYEYDNVEAFDRVVLVSEELLDHFITENRKYEILYTGEYGVELGIEDKELFIEAPLVVAAIEKSKAKLSEENEILKDKVSHLEEQLKALTAALGLNL